MSGRANRESRLFAGFVFLLFLVGVALIAIGTRIQPGFWNQFLVGTGLACAPSAVIAVLFRFFLIDDVRNVTAPMNAAIRRSVADAVPAELGDILDRYRREMDDSDSLRQSGMVRCYPNREEGVIDFLDLAKDCQDVTVTVVGCSLQGLIKDKGAPFANFVEQRANNVRFLLTHPAVAELRAHQENRRKPIGVDIVNTLRLLDELGVPVGNISLYIGTPTLFGIMTDSLMLINPYPYQSTAMNSPSILIRHQPDTESYLYSAFKVAHFSLFDSTMTVQLSDFESDVGTLERNLDRYRKLTDQVTELVSRT